MTRILLIETASPKRILDKAETILQDGAFPNPEIFILCNEKNSGCYRNLSGIRIYAMPERSRANGRMLDELARNRFDLCFAFWTGEKQYRWWKMLGLRLRTKNKRILSGDGNEFRLTWKAIIRHAFFRFRHPLPTDHKEFFPQIALRRTSEPHRNFEKILVIQSAEPGDVLSVLDRLREKPLFADPRFTIFCRNRPEILGSFQGHPMLSRILIHSETQGSWRHWRALRAERFDAVVLLLTGDPSYWKVKIFAFLLGPQRLVIFNESRDCFFFSVPQWLSLLCHRLRVQPYSGAASKWSYSAHFLASLVLKSAIFPFRFLWLLLVWLRLRYIGRKWSRECDDDSL